MKVFVKKSIQHLLASAEEGEHTLKRTLGAGNLVALGIGAIIGAGLFVRTAEAAGGNAGSAVTISFIIAAIGCAFAGFYGKYGASAENIIGFGGIPDNEKTQAFLKLHKEVTGVDSDYNACPYYYANGQVLRQAFEGAGTMDRDAITEYLKSHTFKTLIGEIDLRSQLQNIAYTVGQWQNGFFHSVAGVGVAQSELVAPRVKTGWA